jgi:MFS family permease
MAILCGIVNIPLLVIAFLFYPNFGTKTFFRGLLDLSGNPWLFYVLLIVMALILSAGVAFVMGIAPNWYSSMLDVNLPEHRGTMIATAALLDSIGRAVGSWFGGFIIGVFFAWGSPMPISDTIVLSALTFGIVSALLWIPINKHTKRDIKEITEILEKRAKDLKEQSQKSREVQQSGN